MKKILQLFLFILSFATPCLAQETPAWEFFGGYSWERSDVREYFKSSPIIYTYRNHYVDLNGWDASLTENLNRWVGGVLDISGHYKTLNLRGTKNQERRYSILYGPRISYRTHGVNLFVQALGGVVQAKVKVTPVGPNDSAFSFAMAAGSGVDVNLGKRAAFRLFKAEYFWTNVLGTRQSSYRASAGFVFYWGKVK
jgi:hypothetical protein